MWRLHLSSLYVGHICIIKRPRSFEIIVIVGVSSDSNEYRFSIVYRAKCIGTDDTKCMKFSGYLYNEKIKRRIYLKIIFFERIEFLLLLRMLNFTYKIQPSTSVRPSGVNCTKVGSMTNSITEQSMIYVTDGPHHDAVNKAVFIDTLLPSLIYVCILILIGVPGNSLVICVYLLKLNKSTPRVFILALGLYDLINCITSMPVEVALIWNFLRFDYPVLCKVSRFITATINSGSTFILVAIAVDRFRGICRIFKTTINTTQAKWIVFGSVLFAFSASWPILYLYGTRTILIKLNGTLIIGKTCLIKDDMNNSILPFVFAVFLLSVHFLVDLILVIHYTLIGRFVYRQRQIRTSLKFPGNASNLRATTTPDNLEETKTAAKNPTRRPFSFIQFKGSARKNHQRRPRTNQKGLTREFKESLRNMSSLPSEKGGEALHARKITLMLFIVTVGFVLSFLPHSILVIIRYQDEHFYERLSKFEKSVFQLFLRSYLFNSALNPIVYCFVSQQFRQKSKEVLKSAFGQ